jgi:hypothetical protein
MTRHLVRAAVVLAGLAAGTQAKAAIVFSDNFDADAQA